MEQNIIADCDLKYVQHYVADSEYWGLGIENETYFMLDQRINTNGLYIKKNRRRERYSIDYNNNFKTDELNATLNIAFKDGSTYKIPNYVNAHTFLKTDILEEHRTLYTFGVKYNPKFDGTSIHEHMQFDEWYKKSYENTYVYDGDTCEFITQNFYCATVDSCVDELIQIKSDWLNRTNDLMSKYNLSHLNYPPVNYGIVKFKTNPNNVNMFNNGTYHINITLPTQLNADRQPTDLIKFKLQHSQAIKIIQWIEPLIVALYGSPDILSIHNPVEYSAGSLRLTASRYTGLATYDSDLMIPGKLLQELKLNVDTINTINSWYNKIYQHTKYIPGDHIGYDFNYSKHYNAGIEFRILDWFPEFCLKDFVNILILFIVHAIETNINIKASDSVTWNEFMANVLSKGWMTEIDKNIVEMYTTLKLPEYNTKVINDYFIQIIKWLYDKYSKNPICKKLCGDMKLPYIYNVNAYMWENNCLNYISIDSYDELTQQLYDVYKSKRNNIRQQTLINRISDKFVDAEINTIEDFHKILIKINFIEINKYVLN